MMKKFLLALPLLLFIASGAFAQCPSQTPNVGFQVPNIGNTTNWGICWNGDLAMLDNLLGGSATFPVGTATAPINQHTNWVTANVAPQPVTNITGGHSGQTINIFCGVSDTFTSIVSSATINVPLTWNCSTSKSITLTYVGTVWNEVSRASASSGAIGGTIANEQIGFGVAPGSIGGSNNFLYKSLTGVQTILAPTLIFAAPTVTPAVAGTSTWGYTIIARQGNVNIATSAEGVTALGTATLSPTDKNVIAWPPVPGGTAYDIFLSTDPLMDANIGYLATVTGTTYTDTGTPSPNGSPILNPPESGFQDVRSGIHAGNMSWSDFLNIPNGGGGPYLSSIGLGMDSPINILIQESSTPPDHGLLTNAPDFTGANFIAY